MSEVQKSKHIIPSLISGTQYFVYVDSMSFYWIKLANRKTAVKTERAGSPTD